MMQIGSRWSAGASPHPSVPEALHAAIAEVDARTVTGSDAQPLSWTLTWLEGRPVCTRADDIVVTVSPQGAVSVTYPGDVSDDDTDDDWLLE